MRFSQASGKDLRTLCHGKPHKMYKIVILYNQPMHTLSLSEFRANASAMINRVAQGETARILPHGKPVAELVPEIASSLSEVHDSSIDVHPVSPEIEALAMEALHIGTAQVARVDLFVTADRKQALAAQAAGLKTELIEA